MTGRTADKATALSTTDIDQPLLQPADLGGLRLPNRVVMAPVTRARATNAATGADGPACGVLRPAGRRRPDHHRGRLGERAGDRLRQRPGHLHRAAGRRVAPGDRASFTRWAAGSWCSSGMPAPTRIPITRRANGRPDPSAINPGEILRTRAGRQPTITPRAMSAAEIGRPSCRLRRRREERPPGRVRRRRDRRQRHVADRAVPQPAAEPPDRPVRRRPHRLLLEIVDAVMAAWDGRRAGVRLSPFWGAADRACADQPDPTDTRTPPTSRRSPTTTSSWPGSASARVGYLHLRGRAPDRPGGGARLRRDRPVPQAVRRSTDREPRLRPGAPATRSSRPGSPTRCPSPGSSSPIPISSAGSRSVSELASQRPEHPLPGGARGYTDYPMWMPSGAWR